MQGFIPEWRLQDRLERARKEAGLDQTELALRMDVSRNTVNRAESGIAVPRRIVLNAWALATGVDRKWLETGVVNAESPSPDGEGLSEECTPRDLNPEPTDIRSLIARRSAREDATRLRPTG